MRSLGPRLAEQLQAELDRYISTRTEWQACKALLPLSLWRRLQRGQQLEAARRELAYAVAQALADIDAPASRAPAPAVQVRIRVPSDTGFVQPHRLVRSA